MLPFLLVYQVPGFEDLLSLDASRIFQLAPITNLQYANLLQGILLLGTGLSALGVLSLRSSFSIMTEARELVTGGIYRYISHPMYLGQFLTYFGIASFHSSRGSWILYVVFLGLQFVRLRLEERKLKGAFSEYDAYRKSCWIAL